MKELAAFTWQILKRLQISLKEWEKSCSSTYGELRSIEHGLGLMGPEVRVVRYGNDNYEACQVLESGSMKRDCRMLAKRIAV